jgi:hypothetical protein
MLEYQKSPAPRTTHRAANVFILDPSKRDTACRPEGGAATVRFLVLQHERRRCATLGPRAKQTISLST